MTAAILGIDIAKAKFDAALMYQEHYMTVKVALIW